MKFTIKLYLFLEIEDLPPGTQEQLYSELLDRDAQRELEEESHIINWSQVFFFTELTITSKG